MSASLLSQAGVKGDDDDVSVRISEKAEFKGFISALGVAHFLGVQFARIPARFRQAQLLPPQSHCATVDATEYGPICPQAPDNLRSIRQHLFAGAPAANLAQSEYDCLRLNIYAPKSVISSGNKVPVLVWIHGGGWSIENGNADFCKQANPSIKHTHTQPPPLPPFSLCTGWSTNEGTSWRLSSTPLD